MRNKIFGTIGVIGLILIALSTLSSFGYLLYSWGSVGLAFSTSAWLAFVLWLELLIIGFLAVFIGYVGSKY